MAVKRKDAPVRDLRSALEFLRGMQGQLVETEVEVDPAAELSGVYRSSARGVLSSGPRARTVRRCSSKTSRATPAPRRP